jgi:hypothetical protein
MMKTINSFVSFGNDVHKPRELETWTTDEVLHEIRTGRWRDQVERVRCCPYRSKEQRTEKLKLPFFTPSAEFAYRKSEGLIRHSGQIGIDVDDLTAKQCLKVISRAVLDRYCLAAFHSASGRGVRLLICVPTSLDRLTHPIAFRQVTAHVKSYYRVNPDPGGSDVSRVCFVTYDKGLWVNRSAEPFPVLLLPIVTAPQGRPARPVTISVPEQRAQVPGKLNLGEVGAYHLGLHCAPRRLKPDGTCYTHHSLFKVAKHLAMLICKRGFSKRDAKQLIKEAFAGWLAGIQRSEYRLRGEGGEYQRELIQIVQSSLKRPGISKAAVTWSRWLAHPKFPTDGEPETRLLFAIKKHCRSQRSKAFFLSCRDAMVIAGVRSTRTAAKLLHDICRRRIVIRSRDGKHGAIRRQRHAQWYYVMG